MELNYNLKLETRNENAKESVCMKIRQVSEHRNYLEHIKGWICKGKREDEPKFNVWADGCDFPWEPWGIYSQFQVLIHLRS